MLKSLFITSLSMMVLAAGSAQAAPAYGTRMPEKGRFHVGAQTHAVGKRELEDENGEMKSIQHFLLISYGLADWLTLDLKGGAGDTHHKPDAGEEISYPAYMAGGYGFRLKLYEKEGTKAVFGFQHISVHPYSVFIGNVKHKAVIDDWQLSFLASRTLGPVTPYAGMRWSRMDIIHWTDDDRNRVKSDLNKSAGLIIGADFPVNKDVWINAEGNFLDAQAVAVSLLFRF